MDSIKQLIIKFCEERGHASKTGICDYLRDIKGTTGDCVSRRLRELVQSGIVRKEEKEFAGKKYFEYSVVDWRQDEIQADTTSMEEKLEALTLL